MIQKLVLIIISLHILSCNFSNIYFANEKDIKIVSPNIQNGNISSKYFIMPIGSKNVLCKIENSDIIEIDEIDIPIESKYYVDSNEYIVCLDQLDKQFVLSKIESDENVKIVRKVKYPSDFFPFTILKHKNRIILGGSSYSDMKSFYSFNLNKNTWIEIILPESEKHKRSIDDLLIQGDTLFAVDNLITPKYLITYDLSDEDSIKNIEFEQLYFAHVNQGIMKAIKHTNLIVILSATKAPIHNHDYLGVFRFSSKMEGFELIHDLSNQTYYNPWIDFVIHNDKIIIASFRDIKVLKIKNEYYEYIENSINALFENDININLLEDFYSIDRGAIIGLRYLPNNSKLIVLRKSNNKYKYEVLNI